MADIFDQLTAPPAQGDIFDQLSGQGSVPTGSDLIGGLGDAPAYQIAPNGRMTPVPIGVQARSNAKVALDTEGKDPYAPVTRGPDIFDQLASQDKAAPQRSLGQDEIEASIAQQAMENNPANTAKLSEGIGKGLDYASQKIEELSPGFLQQFTTSPLPSPNLPPDPNDSRLEAARKAIINSVGGLVEGVSSPAMVAGVGAGAAVPAIGRALATGFGVDMARSVPEQVNRAINAPTFQEQLEGGLGAASQVLMAGAAFKHGLSSPEARAAIEKELPKVAPAAPETKPQDFGPVGKQAAPPDTTNPAQLSEKPVPSVQPIPDVQPPLVQGVARTELSPSVSAETPSQPEVSPIEAQPASKTGLPEAFSGLAKGISDNFYNAAFDSLQRGKETISGVKDPILAKAKPFFDNGEIQSPSDLKDLVQSGRLSKGPEPPPPQGESGVQGQETPANPVDMDHPLDTSPVVTRETPVGETQTMGNAAAPDAASSEPRISGIAQRVHDARAEAGKIGEIQPGNEPTAAAPKTALDQVLERNEPLTADEQRQVQREIDAEQVRLQSDGKIINGSDLPNIGEAQPAYSGIPIPEALKIKPETQADIAGAVGGFFKPSKFTPFKEVLNKWVGDRQKATLEGKDVREAVKAEVPNVHKLNGISIYREAGGDRALIARQAAAAKSDWFRMAAQQALKLNPKDIATAARLDSWYQRKGQRAQATGLIEHLRNDYVNHVWEDSPQARKVMSGGGKLNTAFRPSKERIVPSLFEGDQAGLKPKSINASELAAIYAHSMDRALGDRRFVKNLVNTSAPDGRPIGISQQAADMEAKQARATGNPNPYEDYKDVRHWAFKGEDYRGDIKVHPDYANHVEAAIRPSTIDRPEEAATAAGRLSARAFQKVLAGQSFVKQNMLSIPAFHYVQEGTEALGHHINPFANEPIDPHNPVHVDAMNHGLMVASTRGGEAQWMDGLNTSKALLTKIPGIGPKLKASSEYLFEKYIPSIKMETYKAALNRNLDRMKPDLASGKVTVDDIKYHTAQQVNDAYGHQNYADMGMSENVQKITQATLLAPDFLFSRVKQALHGVAGLVPGVLARAHGEQRMAFWTLAVGQYMLARGLNYMLNDDHDMHLNWKDAFAVFHNGRRYSMRSVPGDVLEAVTDYRKFLTNRLSPAVHAGTEWITGTNYRGQKVRNEQALKDVATTAIPLGLKHVAAMVPGLKDVGDKETSWGQQAMQNLGVKVQRASPVIDAHRIAHDWMKQQPDYKEDTGVYPTSQYRGLQNALEDKNKEAAQREYKDLVATMKPAAIKKGMNASLTKAFTKSKEGDSKMLKQLPPDDRAIVQAAIAQRKQILQQFRAMPKPSPTPQTNSRLDQIRQYLSLP